MGLEGNGVLDMDSGRELGTGSGVRADTAHSVGPIAVSIDVKRKRRFAKPLTLAVPNELLGCSSEHLV